MIISEKENFSLVQKILTGSEEVCVIHASVIIIINVQ